MPLSETVLIVSGLLTLAILVAGLCRSWPIPHSVVLVVLGMLLGELSRVWAPLAPLHEFRLSPDVVFAIFLPALIFESGFNLNARQLVKDLAPVLVMAVPALLISTGVIGLGLWFVLGVEPITAALFGALISATDPVAVVALFRELGAPPRLTVMVEGEALLNDATAIVVFGILLGIAGAGAGPIGPALAGAAGDFLAIFLGGTAVGIAMGLAVSELLYRMRSGLSAILAMSLVMAYASFLLAEHVLHTSGVMAAASAAVSLSFFGVTRLPRRADAAIGETWELIALVCNSLLFLLLGLLVEPLPIISQIGPIVVAAVLVIAARAAAVYGLVPLTTWLFRLPRVSVGERHILWWGGLKGGLAIAIVLATPEDLPGRALLLDLTLGVVLFTLLVNAPTIRPLMRWLGLDRLSEDERTELRQSIAAARRMSDLEIDRFVSAGLASTRTDRNVRSLIHATLAQDPSEAEAPRHAREVHLVALRAEFAELNRLYELDVIPQYTYLDIRTTLQRDRGRAPSTLAKDSGVRRSPFLGIERGLLSRLREKDWATGLLARYQDLRLAQRLQYNVAGILMSETVLETLAAHSELDEQAREAATAVYAERLARRKQRVESVRRDFPEFFERFEAQLLARVALKSALRNVAYEHHQGEIGAKPFSHIEHSITAALSQLKPLTEAVPQLATRDLIGVVPLLSGLSETSLAALADRAQSVTFLAGDVVIAEGQRGDALYIITRGEVEVCQARRGGEDVELNVLSSGDFFGELALLGDHQRTATVKALTLSTMLRLVRRDVLALAKENPEVRRRLEDARRAREANVGETHR
jgi:CPA1 family monovalent cation:H+ antiporter